MPKLSQRTSRIIKTAVLYINFIISGMALSVTGPTLLDLQHIVNTDTQNIAFIYTARSTGYAFGSLLGGFLFDITNKKQALLTILTTIVSITTIAMPWSTRIEILTSLMVFNGLALSAVDTGSNVLCLTLWGKDSGPFYQALHFTYGIGGLISPLIAAPFLGKYDYDTEINPLLQDPKHNFHFNSSTTLNSTLPSLNFNNFLQPLNNLSNNSVVDPLLVNLNSTHFDVNSTESAVVEGVPSVVYAYGIIGGLFFVPIVMFLALAIVDPVDENEKKSESKDTRKNSKLFTWTLIMLNFFLLFVVVGTEVGFAQMLTTYAVKGTLRLSKVTGSYMTSAFWAAFTLSRLVTIFLTLKFSNFSLIVYDIVVTSAGSLVLLFLAETEEWSMWLGSVLIGIGIASFFPTAIAWMEQYMTITNRIVGFFTVGASFGEMMVPYTISHFIDHIPQVLVFVVLTSSVMTIVIVFIMYMIVRKKEVKYASDKEGVDNQAYALNEKL